MDMKSFVIWILVSIAIGSATLEETTIEGEDYVPATVVPIPLEPSARIVGGRLAEDGQFPYQVSLRYRNVHICGGSIISPTYIVTAAHCIPTTSNGKKIANPASSLTVRAGTSFIYTGGVISQVAETIRHPSYRNFVNDIALLMLRTSLTFSKNIQPIKMATQNVPTGSQILVSGWGRLRTGGRIPTRLQWVTLKAISNRECRGLIGKVPSSILCLAHQRGQGACQGDSGGPAAFNGQLVGVTSFGVGGCGSNAPDGFTNITHYVDWISANSKK